MFKQEHKHFCLMSLLLTSLNTTQGTLLQLPFFCSWWMYCPLISRSTKFMMWRSLAPCFPKSFSSTFSCFYSCLSSRVHSQTSENPCLSPRASPRQNCRRAKSRSWWHFLSPAQRMVHSHPLKICSHIL